MSVLLNQKAPEIGLYNQDKTLMRLSEKKGKNLLLLFFPLAFTSTCTEELCSVRDNLERYSQLNTEVYGISVDSVFTLRKFREEQKLNFDLLSDFNREASQAYDCLYAEFILGMKAVSKRASFVVDSKGVLRYSEVLRNANDLPDFNALRRFLQSAN